MLTKYLAAALVGSALIAAPALAQTTDNKNTATTNQQSTQNKAEQNASQLGLWQASKLINLNVYNNNDEKIGDIKELMLDKQGKIDTVVIGVGGFLGMGEHDVAVKFSELKFTDEPVKSSTSSSGTRPSGTTGTSSTASTTSSSKRNYPDHAMYNATKDQLKALPQFNYNK